LGGAVNRYLIGFGKKGTRHWALGIGEGEEGVTCH
jgi:hypothetical protein